MNRSMLFSVLASFMMVVPAVAQPNAKQFEAAKKKVADMVAARGGMNATITPLTDKALATTCPKHVFFSVRFPQYPVAFMPPKGFQPSNVVAVSDELQLFPNGDSLNKFFLDHFGTWQRPTLEQAKQGTRAFLVLFQELYQDGYYTFEVLPPSAEKVDGKIKTSCRSIVKKGGNGELTIMAEFGQFGGFGVQQSLSLKPGPRPRCQATKLLDRDPIVRYMAEAELRFLGVAARPYLRDQLAKADSTRLRRAIARLLAEIEAAGW